MQRGWLLIVGSEKKKLAVRMIAQCRGLGTHPHKRNERESEWLTEVEHTNSYVAIRVERIGISQSSMLWITVLCTGTAANTTVVNSDSTR